MSVEPKIFGDCNTCGVYGRVTYIKTTGRLRCLNECALEAKYPQGWRDYPGDICGHGVYVGGCGVDHMCFKCEEGES